MNKKLYVKCHSFVVCLFLLSLTGCNQSGLSFGVESQTPTVEVPDNTDEIVTAMQGNYSACVTSPLYPGYYNKVSVNVSGTTFLHTLELSASNTCATYYWRQTFNYEIDKASYRVSGDLKNINLDLKMVNFKLRWNNAGYMNANYDCDLTGWVLNQDKDLTGVECAEVISTYDSFHTSFKDVGDKEYFQIYLGTILGQASPSTTRLVMPIGYTQSGDSEEQRKVHQTATILKL